MGCNCSGGGTGLAAGVLDTGSVAAMREAILNKLANLGSADPCPGGREWTVHPRTGAAMLFTSVRTSPVKGFAPDLVQTFPDDIAALDAALEAMATYGGKIMDACPPR